MHPIRYASSLVAPLGIALCLMAACTQFKAPRLTDEPKNQPQIPASVRLTFDDSVRKATLQETVCADTLWTGQLGDSIMQAFRETGNRRFAQVIVEEVVEKPRLATTMPLSDITAAIRLTDKSFTTRTRTGSGDNYLSQLDIKLLAAFQDGNGRPLGEVPLSYSENVNIFTPQYGGSGQCATQQLDGAMNYAADYLAQLLVGYVSDLTAKLQGYQTAGRQIPGGSPPPVEAPSALTVRVTLLDENNNLVLEGGEKVGIRLDVTNRGAGPVGPATVTLSGSPPLIDAFAAALSSQAQLAGLQAGETTSAILWGRLPATLEGQRGELTVTVTPSGTAGGAPAAQTLVATMVPRGGPASSASSPAIRQAPVASSRAPDPDRYAIIVGLDLYRTPWPGLKSNRLASAEQVASFFRTALGVSDDHILLLQDELAARDDIEDAMTQWLPKRIGSDSVVFLYFGGHAVVDRKNGEVSLLPYDATPSSSPFRWLSLRLVQGRLRKLGAQLTVAIIDASVTVPSHGAKQSPARPAIPADWTADLDNAAVMKGPVLQIVSLRADGKMPASLQVLTSAADLDHDGTVTIGEWLRALRGKALVAPTLPPTLAIQSIPLTQVNHQPRP